MESIDQNFKVPACLQDYRDDHVRTVLAYLHGEKPFTEYSDGKYRCMVMPMPRMPNRTHGYGPLSFMDFNYLNFKEGDPTPVPSGLWLGYWDPDIKTVAGLSRKQYDKLPLVERAKVDARVQVALYIPREYGELRFEFYHPKQYYDRYQIIEKENMIVRKLKKVDGRRNQPGAGTLSPAF